MHQPDNEGYYPIHYAASEGHIKSFENLFEQSKLSTDGISLIEGKTIVHFIVLRDNPKSEKDYSVDFLNYLKERGYDLNQPDSKGLYPIYYTTNLKKINCFSILFDYLLENSHSIPHFPSENLAYLATKIPNGVKVLKYLLDKGHILYKPYRSNEYFHEYEGYYPIHLAVKNGNYEVFEFLHEHMVKNSQTAPKINGQSLAHIAALSPRSYHILNLLDKKKYNLNTKDNQGLYPIHVAIKSFQNREGQENIIGFLYRALQRDRNSNPKLPKNEELLIYAIKNKLSWSVKLLVNKFEFSIDDPAEVDGFSRLPIEVASHHNYILDFSLYERLDIMKFLIEVTKDRNGKYGIFEKIALEGYNLQILQYLIDIKWGLTRVNPILKLTFLDQVIGLTAVNPLGIRLFDGSLIDPVKLKLYMTKKLIQNGAICNYANARKFLKDNQILKKLEDNISLHREKGEVALKSIAGIKSTIKNGKKYDDLVHITKSEETLLKVGAFFTSPNKNNYQIVRKFFGETDKWDFISQEVVSFLSFEDLNILISAGATAPLLFSSKMKIPTGLDLAKLLTRQNFIVKRIPEIIPKLKLSWKNILPFLAKQLKKSINDIQTEISQYTNQNRNFTNYQHLSEQDKITKLLEAISEYYKCKFKVFFVGKESEGYDIGAYNSNNLFQLIFYKDRFLSLESKDSILGKRKIKFLEENDGASEYASRSLSSEKSLTQQVSSGLNYQNSIGTESASAETLKANNMDVYLHTETIYNNSNINIPKIQESLFTTAALNNDIKLDQLLELLNDKDVTEVLIDEVKEIGSKKMVKTLFEPVNIQAQKTIRLEETKDIPNADTSFLPYSGLLDRAITTIPIINIVIDSAYAAYIPTRDNLFKAASSVSYTVAALNGNILASAFIGTLNAAYSVGKGNHLEAAVNGIVSMLLPQLTSKSVTGEQADIFKAIVTSTAIVGFANKVFNIIAEYNSGKLEKLHKAQYKYIQDLLAETYEQLFSSEINNYENISMLYYNTEY